MNIVKYLCEFFFCHFWHFIGLWIIIATICGASIVHFNDEKESYETKDKQN